MTTNSKANSWICLSLLRNFSFALAVVLLSSILGQLSYADSRSSVGAVANAVLAQGASAKRVNVIIMLDLTGSTNSTDTPRNDLALEKQAARELLQNFSGQGGPPYVAIGTFNKISDEAARILPTGQLTNKYGSASPATGLYAALNSLTTTSGFTDIAAAINVAQSDLADKGAGGANFIILISDGTPNRPGLGNYEDCGNCGCPIAYAATEAAAQAARQAGTTLMAVHYAGSNPATNYCDEEPKKGFDFMGASIASGPAYFFEGTGNLSGIFATISCAIKCDDGNSCTQDTCDSAGTCSHTSVLTDLDQDGSPDCLDLCVGRDQDLGQGCGPQTTLGGCQKVGVYRCSPQNRLVCVGEVELDRATCFGCADSDLTPKFKAVEAALAAQLKAIQTVSSQTLKNRSLSKPLRTAVKKAAAQAKALKLTSTVSIASLSPTNGICQDQLSCYQVSDAASVAELRRLASGLESQRATLGRKLKRTSMSRSAKAALSSGGKLLKRSLFAIEALPTFHSSCK